MENRSILIICVIAIVIAAISTTYVVYDNISSSTTDVDSNINETTIINETTTNDTQDASTSSEDISNEYPEYSSTFGNYKILGTNEEQMLIETSDGNKYVLGGDGYYTYTGTSSGGGYELGSYVGKY